MELDLAALDSLGDAAVDAILHAWTAFYASADALLAGDVSADPDLADSVRALCARGLGPLVQDHFLSALEETFKKNAVLKFWKHFDSPLDANTLERHKPYRHWAEEVLMESLEEISAKKAYQEKCLRSLICSLQSHMERKDGHRLDTDGSYLLSKYQLIVSSVLLTTLPSHFPGVLRSYFSKQLDDLNKLMTGESEEGEETQYHETLDFEKDISPSGAEMDVDVNHNSVISRNHTLIKKIGRAVHYLRNLGFKSLTEDAYASAIFLLLKTKVYSLAGDDYRIPVLQSIKEWIQVVPLQFLHALLAYLGDTVDDATASLCPVSPLASETLCLPWITKPSEVLVRWQLRLEYFAYETLQDLRIAKLFEIIVDYPESSPAIDDLRQCLDYTGQHSKLVGSFISSLRCRLLTAGASTNDILHQYVSTIKALRTIDPTGVFLEAVGEPIRDYLRGRKDTIKCIVTMLTEGSGGNAGGSGNTGDSLLEELNRDTENKENSNYDDNLEIDDKQAWLNAERWEPDRVEAGPFQGGNDRRKIDILGMLVSVIGSKDQLVNEYRVMLAEKLVSKSDYDIDSEIRTVELLKIHFGESSMQKCEIMISDLIGSKRINSNIKASMPHSSKPFVENEDNKVSLDLLDATIISSHFWPPIQAECINIPTGMDQLLSDYAKRFHEIKTPRKLIWLKNLGTVKIELQFGGKNLQFTVSPVHAAIIMKFQDQMSWTSKDLADAVGLSVDALNRRITFWISKGILAESPGVDCDNHIFTIVDETIDMNRSAVGSGNCEDLLTTEEEGERSVVSVEEQLQKEMTVYEKFIIGMLTNFGNMGLDRIHNTLKMFCIAEPSYDKSLQQLQSFLSALVLEEKLDIRDGLYFLKK